MSAKMLRGQGKGFTVCPNGILEDMKDAATKISSTEVAVYLVLNRRINPNGDQVAWPSVETICADCGLSNKTVISALKNLLKRGWIESKRRFGASTIYTIKYEATPPDPFDAVEKPQMSSPIAATAQPEAQTLPNHVNPIQLENVPVMENLHNSDVDFTQSLMENLHSNKNSPNKNSNNKNSNLNTPENSDPLTHIFNRATQPKTIKKEIIKARISDETWRDACLKFSEYCDWVTAFNAGSWIGVRGRNIEEFIKIYKGEDWVLIRAAELVRAQAKIFNNPMIYPTLPAGLNKYMLAARAERTAKANLDSLDSDEQVEKVYEY